MRGTHESEHRLNLCAKSVCVEGMCLYYYISLFNIFGRHGDMMWVELNVNKSKDSAWCSQSFDSWVAHCVMVLKYLIIRAVKMSDKMVLK